MSAFWFERSAPQPFTGSLCRHRDRRMLWVLTEKELYGVLDKWLHECRVYSQWESALHYEIFEYVCDQLDIQLDWDSHQLPFEARHGLPSNVEYYRKRRQWVRSLRCKPEIRLTDSRQRVLLRVKYEDRCALRLGVGNHPETLALCGAYLEANGTVYAEGTVCTLPRPLYDGVKVLIVYDPPEGLVSFAYQGHKRVVTVRINRLEDAYF